MALITMKFGGTSVGSADAIENLVGIVTASLGQDNQVAVVVSAMSGVTDMLLGSVKAALRGDKWGFIQLNKDIRDKHEEAIHVLLEAGTIRHEVLASVEKLLKQHLELCEALAILGEATPRISDAVVSYGERLSARLVAAVLQARGVRAQAYDATQFIVTDERHQNAEPLWLETEKRIDESLKPILASGVTPVLTGFIGATKAGMVTTLGRGGSDFSGAIFAAYLEADACIIWTDVDGVMTTDPRIDPRARVMPYISYAEVGEMAFYGAKVLHPKTVQPIIAKRIPLYVRNTFNPQHPGTRIGAEQAEGKGIIKAVTAIKKVSLLTVTGKGMLGVPGIAGRTFLATAKAGASVLMISQSSSEQSICFSVPDDRADVVKQAIESELATEIAHQDIDAVDVQDDIAIVTVVGSRMRHRPGVAGRVFTTMGDVGVNIYAIAQGSSEVSISFVIAQADIDSAVRALHDLALQEYD